MLTFISCCSSSLVQMECTVTFPTCFISVKQGNVERSVWATSFLSRIDRILYKLDLSVTTINYIKGVVGDFRVRDQTHDT